MRQLLLVIAVFMSLAPPAVTQSPTPEPKYQIGTVIAMKAHDSAGPHDDTIAYDVTINAGEKDYVVLYTPPSTARGMTFVQGHQVMVRVGTNALGFRDIMGRYLEFPILASRPASDRQSPESR